MMLRVRWLAVVALTAGCGTHSPGREAIVFTKIQTVVGPSADGGFEGMTLLSPELRGGRRIAIQPNPPVGLPLIVGTDGRIVDTLARAGAGPGEVEQVSRVIRGLGDSVFVVDAGRISVYSPELHFVRSFPSTLHSAWSAAALRSGDLVLASATFGVPEVVTVVSPQTGEHRWGIQNTQDPAARISKVRFVAVAPDGTLWTLKGMGSLEFEHYGADGSRLGGITATVAWYPPYDRYQMPSRTAPASPTATGFWVDSLGRAWVVGLATDPKWASATGKDQPGEGGSTYFIADHVEEVRDGILDVIDLTSGRSVLSVRSDSLYGIPVEPWVVQRIRTDADGWRQVDLYRVSSAAAHD